MPPSFHRNSSTAVSENFRRELRDFQVFHANMRLEEEKKSKKLFDELSNATKRRFETNGSRNDPISAIRQDDAVERASLTKDLENRIGSRAREEWYARLDKAGLSAELWTDVTPAENDVLSGLLWGRNDVVPSVPPVVSFNEESLAHTPSMASRGPQLWTPPESARAELPAPSATASQGQRVTYNNNNNTPSAAPQQLPEHLKSPHVPFQSTHPPPLSQSHALPQTHPRRNTVASSAPAQVPIASTTKISAPSAIPQDGQQKAHSRPKGPTAQLSDANEDDQDTETEHTYKAHLSFRKSASADSKVVPIRAEPPKAQPKGSPPNHRSEIILFTPSTDAGILFPTPPESTLTSSVPLPSETEPDAEWKASLRSKIEEKLRPVINDARAHNNHDLSDMSSIAEGLYQDELAQERRRLVEMQAREETRLKSESAKQKAEERKSTQKRAVSPPTTQKTSSSSSQPIVQKTIVSHPTVQKQPLSQPKQAAAESSVQKTAIPQPSIQKQVSAPVPAQHQTASPPVQKQVAQKPPSPTASKSSAQQPTTTPAQRPAVAPAQKPASSPVQKTPSSQSLQKQTVPQKPKAPQPFTQKQSAPQTQTQTPIQKQAPPAQKQTPTQKSVAPSTSSSASKTTEQITPPPTPGSRYIGPELTSEEKDKEEAAFDAFLLAVRKQKIVEFHQAAATMEVELADELHTHRLVGSQLKAVLKKHDNDMLKLKERMEQERKAMCDAEKARRVAELGALTRDARSAESEDSQTTQKTRVRSGTIRPNRPDDGQAEKSRSATSDANGSPKMAATTASSAEVQKVTGSPPTNTFQPPISPTPTFSPRILEGMLVPTSFATIEKREDSTFVPPTPRNSPRPLESPRKATIPTLPVEQQHSPSSSSESSLDRIPPTPGVVGRSLIDEPMVAPPSVIEASSRHGQEQHYQSGTHQFSNITLVTPSMTLPQIYDSLSTDEEEGFFPAMVHPRQVRFTPSAVGGNSDSDSDLNSEPELDERARALRNTLGLSAGYDARVGGERWTGHGDAVSHNRKRGPSRAPTAAPLIGKKELPEIWYPPPEEKTIGRVTPGTPLTPHQNWNEWS